MTDAATIDRQDTLYITDAELIRRMSYPHQSPPHLREIIRGPNDFKGADPIAGFWSRAHTRGTLVS